MLTAGSNRNEDERDFTELLDSLGDGVFEIDGNGEFLYMNAKMLDLLHMTFKQVQNTPIWDMAEEADIPRTKAYFREQFRKKRKFAYIEYRLKPRYGKSIWIGQSSTMAYKGSRVVRLRAIARDISENRELKRELRVKDSQYKLVSENSSDLVILFDPHGIVNFASLSSKELLGFDPDEMVGKKSTDLLHPCDIKTMKLGFKKRVLEGESISELEFRIKSKNGIYLWVESYVKPILNDEGKVQSILTTSRNITERKKEDERRAKFREGLRLLNILASQPVHSDDSIKEALKKVADYLDMPWGVISEIIGNNYRVIYELSPNGECRLLDQPIEYELKSTYCDLTLRNNGEISINDMENSKYASHPCYEKFGMESYIGVIITKTGAIDGYGTVNFSSKEKRAEPFTQYDEEFIMLFSNWLGSTLQMLDERKLLEHAKKAAEEALIAKAKLLSVMSHELRTPINGILGSANLLALNTPREDQLSKINILKESGNHLLAIVNDVLDFSKIDQGKLAIDSIEFNLRETVFNIHEHYQVMAGNTLEVNVFYDPELNETYFGDPFRLSQILHNLASNAVKFTQKGSVGFSFKKLESHGKFDKILVEVEDTGSGIPESQQALIFEEFGQGTYNNKYNHGGTGLGLTIIKKLLELMDSRISLKSEVGKGSLFSFELILEVGLDTGPQTDTVAANSFAPIGANILLVEDNAFNRVIARDFLESWECKVTEATNGLEALEKLNKNEDFDLIVMDIQMPKMGGLEATERIRSNAKFDEVPILGLSATTDADVKRQAYKAGMSNFVAKPFHPKEFHTKLRSYIIDESSLQKEKQLKSVIAQLEQRINGVHTRSEEYLNLFFEAMNESLFNLEKGIQNRNRKSVGKYAHRGKSDIKFMGLYSLASEAEQLDHMIKNENPDGMFFSLAVRHLEHANSTLSYLKSEMSQYEF